MLMLAAIYPQHGVCLSHCLVSGTWLPPADLDAIRFSRTDVVRAFELELGPDPARCHRLPSAAYTGLGVGFLPPAYSL